MLAANLLFALAKVLDIAIMILMWTIIARAVISWFQPNPYNQLVRFLYLATEPFLFPIRRFLSRYIPPMGIDISPLAVILILIFLRRFLVTSLYQLAARM